MTTALVLDALGDETRRTLLDHLRAGPSSVTELTGVVPVTQPAVSQHLKVLRHAGLVECEVAGRRRIYRVRRDGLAELRAYVDSFWDEVLDAFVESSPSSKGTQR